MKQLVRLFFKTIRIVVGPVILFVDWLTTPKGMIRGAAEQQAVNEATRQLTLYQFKTCPFCMKVRRASKRRSLITRRNMRATPTAFTPMPRAMSGTR